VKFNTRKLWSNEFYRGYSCSRLSVSEDDRKSKRATSGISGERNTGGERRRSFPYQALLVVRSLFQSSALTESLEQAKFGRGLASNCFKIQFDSIILIAEVKNIFVNLTFLLKEIVDSFASMTPLLTQCLSSLWGGALRDNPRNSEFREFL